MMMIKLILNFRLMTFEFNLRQNLKKQENQKRRKHKRCKEH